MLVIRVRCRPAHCHTSPNIRRWTRSAKSMVSSRSGLATRRPSAHNVAASMFACSARLRSARVATKVGISPSMSSSVSGVTPVASPPGSRVVRGAPVRPTVGQR